MTHDDDQARNMERWLIRYMHDLHKLDFIPRSDVDCAGSRGAWCAHGRVRGH